jgi:formylglycine-generating enzyme required for sulfatase activity
MKKRILFCCLAAFVCFYFTACENQIMKNWWEESKKEEQWSRDALVDEEDIPDGITHITVTGFSVLSKVYDGTTTAAITGTPVLQGVKNGDDVTFVKGTVDFKDANAGNGKQVIFKDWSLGGANASDYVLKMPKLTADIIKADPVITWPSGLFGIIEQALSYITLPGNGTCKPDGTFSWTIPSDSIIGTDTQSHNMTFTPNDTLNYNTVTMDVAVTVISAVKMILIPKGNFIMGSPESEPNRFPNEEQHTVNMSGFYMSEYPVTQELYKAVMGSNPSYFNKPVAGETGTPDKLPVDQVSWYDALVFCNRLSMIEGLSPAYQMNNKTDPADWGPVPVKPDRNWDCVEIVSGSNGYRLPTEAQWEYACRAGTTTAYNTGVYFNDDVGWFRGNSGQSTHEVGLKLPNAWGLYDMYGNVAEWCWDWYYYSYPSVTVTDPMGPPTGTNRIIRGGHWDYSFEFMRSARRGSHSPDIRFSASGIRLVLPN